MNRRTAPKGANERDDIVTDIATVFFSFDNIPCNGGKENTQQMDLPIVEVIVASFVCSFVTRRAAACVVVATDLQRFALRLTTDDCNSPGKILSRFEQVNKWKRKKKIINK